MQTMAMARFAPKPCGRADGSEGFVVSKPCGRIGWERRLCHVKAVRSMAMARFTPKPCGRVDGIEGFVVSKQCGRADRPGGRG